MRQLIQFCVLFVAAHRISAQTPFYLGRQRDGRFGASRFGSTGAGVFQDAGRISGFGGARGFSVSRQPGFSSQRSFRTTGFTTGPSRFSSSLDRRGSRFGSQVQSSRGRVSSGRLSGGLRNIPEDVRRVIGSSVLGRPARMGELDLPRHGGAGAGEEHANGLMRGWDGNPQTLGNRFEHEWSDPFRGGPVPRLPPGFNGNFGGVPGMPPMFG